jgi:hypothetical protein
MDPFQNLLAPARFGCFRKKTRFISNARAPSAGATGNLGRYLCIDAVQGAPHAGTISSARPPCWVSGIRDGGEWQNAGM